MSKSIAIMGAGPGGLAASLLLAARGAEVNVFERKPCVGGRTGQIKEQGFKFDLGPTFFLYPEILKDIFKRCGANLDDRLELIKLDPQYEVKFENNGSIKATSDLAALKKEISKFSGQDASQIDAFMKDNVQKFAAFKPILEQPFNGLSDLLSLSALKGLPKLRPFSSVDDDLSKFFSDEKVRLAFSFQSKYLGMSPFNCPSLFTILSFMEYQFGVYHPIGGCHQIMKVMADLAIEMGVKIHLEEPVKNLDFKGKCFTGVSTSRQSYSANALVANADFAHVANNFLPQRLLKKWNREKLKNKKYSCSTFMIYLGIKGSYPDLQHHTIYLSEDYKGNLADIENGGSLPERPSLYIQNASQTDSSLAPEGYSTLYILVPVANQKKHINWVQHFQHYKKKIYSRLQSIGIENIEKRIVYEKILTPSDWQSEYNIEYGATFNLTHSLDQMLLMRPKNRFDELDGVYLVGGGTHPGSGLPVIFQGADISTKLLANDLGLCSI